MTEEKQAPFEERFTWLRFVGVVIVAVLIVLATYFFVYRRVGA